MIAATRPPRSAAKIPPPSERSHRLSPELTQAAYRVSDSATNILSPLLPYFAVIIAVAQRYDKRIGIGSLISVMLPYSIAFWAVWTVMMLVWMLFGLPLGPNAPIYYEGV